VLSWFLGSNMVLFGFIFFALTMREGERLLIYVTPLMSIYVTLTYILLLFFVFIC